MQSAKNTSQTSVEGAIASAFSTPGVDSLMPLWERTFRNVTARPDPCQPHTAFLKRDCHAPLQSHTPQHPPSPHTHLDTHTHTHTLTASHAQRSSMHIDIAQWLIEPWSGLGTLLCVFLNFSFVKNFKIPLGSLYSDEHPSEKVCRN